MKIKAYSLFVVLLLLSASLSVLAITLKFSPPPKPATATLPAKFFTNCPLKLLPVGKEGGVEPSCLRVDEAGGIWLIDFPTTVFFAGSNVCRIRRTEAGYELIIAHNTRIDPLLPANAVNQLPVASVHVYLVNDGRPQLSSFKWDDAVKNSQSE